MISFRKEVGVTDISNDSEHIFKIEDEVIVTANIDDDGDEDYPIRIAEDHIEVY